MSRCSLDPSISLDAANPSGCDPRSEGEGAREAANGSSDDDDLFVLGFGWPGRLTPEPEPGILNDTRRPLVFWQMELASPNGLVVLKDVARDGVVILYR